MGILSLIFAIVLYGMEHSDDQGADVITYISHGIWMGFIVRHYSGYVQCTCIIMYMYGCYLCLYDTPCEQQPNNAVF